MSAEEIVSKLMHNDGSFPRRALELAIKERDIVAPRLLQEVKYSVENIEEIDGNSTYMLHIYALYLLAQFRETKAYPLIVEFFSLPGDTPQDVTGDVITEDLGRILASTFDGDIVPLKVLIESRSVNECTRSAALQTMCILWSRDVLTRQQIIEYFSFLISEKFVGELSGIWSSLVAHSLVLSPNELEVDIEKAFDQGLIETFYIGREDFRSSLGLSDEEALIRFKRNRRSSLIDNTITEMEHWACFNSKARTMVKSGGSPLNGGKVKISRNAPCPCGSGTKYKKCCLLADQEKA